MNGLPLDLSSLRLDLLGGLLTAAVLGGIIGLERELHGKPAGFRTNLLICVGAALLTDLSMAIARTAAPGAPVADPGRIAAQIVSGIGFIGAGTILHSRGSVTGLTTAATIWVVAAIGIAVGAGAYVEAFGTTALVVIALLLLGKVERAAFQRAQHREIRLSLVLAPDALERVQGILDGAEADVEELEAKRREDQIEVSLLLSAPGSEAGALVRRLLADQGVRQVNAR